MSASTLATLNALLKIGLFAFNSYAAVRSGDKTPEQVRAEWPTVAQGLDDAWAAWDEAASGDQS